MGWDGKGKMGYGAQSGPMAHMGAALQRQRSALQASQQHDRREAGQVSALSGAPIAAAKTERESRTLGNWACNL